MSFKAVELQIAVPRTVEQGRVMQNQLQQHLLQQAQQAEEQVQQTALSEQTVADSKENARLGDRKADPRYAKMAGKRRTDGEEAEEADAPHPYKGHRLDIKM